VQIVDDRRDVPKKPAVHLDLPVFQFWVTSVERPITRPLELQRHHRALGVNALDEVPDSTWFTNRIGVRELSRDEIKRGPVTDDGPEQHVPWTVHSTKLNGEASSGLIIIDARGVKYQLKFGDPSHPELESGAQVIVNRLMWACGYHVAADMIVHFRPQDLTLDPKATKKGRLAETKGKLTQADLDHAFATMPHDNKGRIRALASRWLDGVSLGGYSPEGVRKGDPNDRIRHERRRDLRGEYAMFEWVEHTEGDQSNLLDMWVEDPGDHRHYVEHYQIDFDGALGAKALLRSDLHEGHMHAFSFWTLFYGIVSLGFDPRRQTNHLGPIIHGVSPSFVTTGFDPNRWTTDQPYAPFIEADRYDKFWGAGIVARFTPDQIRAAVEAAEFSDPHAVDYVTDTLVARQRILVEHWFDTGVNPLASFAISSGALCFDDLAISSGIASQFATKYAITPVSEDAKPLAAAQVRPASGVRTCHPVTLTGDYAIVRISTERKRYKGDTFVHLGRDPQSGGVRVIGIWRA
jgi:hypothetical protein